MLRMRVGIKTHNAKFIEITRKKKTKDHEDIVEKKNYSKFEGDITSRNKNYYDLLSRIMKH